MRDYIKQVMYVTSLISCLSMSFLGFTTKCWATIKSNDDCKCFWPGKCWYQFDRVCAHLWSSFKLFSVQLKSCTWYELVSECQLPECQLPKYQPKRQLPKMSTPEMPTPKMSTSQNLKFTSSITSVTASFLLKIPFQLLDIWVRFLYYSLQSVVWAF